MMMQPPLSPSRKTVERIGPVLALTAELLIAIFAAQMSNPKGRDGGRSRMGMSPRRFCIQELFRSKGVVQQAVLGLWARTRLSIAPIR
jgi:hypothetical protein